jgi:hypothetical protein
MKNSLKQKQESLSIPKKLQQSIRHHLIGIEKIIECDVKLTIIGRFPKENFSDFVISSDDFNKLIALVKVAKKKKREPIADDKP